MSVEYTNRKGKTHYLHQSVTKTGKTRYFFSQSAEGDLADVMPDGYEVYENPNGRVYARKIVPRVVSDAELASVEAGMRRFSRLEHFQVDVKKGTISIHTPNQNVGALLHVVRSFVGAPGVDAEATIEKLVAYSPELRFVLIDKEERLFQTERYCYRGSIDDWIEIGAPDRLKALVRKYVKHLGQDSFFELC
jgi:hypothetical protein